MGLFDFFKKPKSDLDQYYEERNKRMAQENAKMGTANEAQFNQQVSFESYSQGGFRIVVEDVFTITGRGTVIVGKVASGYVHVGDTVMLNRVNGFKRDVTVTGIEKFRKLADVAQEGENVGILLRGLTKDEIGKGDVLTKA